MLNKEFEASASNFTVKLDYANEMKFFQNFIDARKHSQEIPCSPQQINDPTLSNLTDIEKKKFAFSNEKASVSEQIAEKGGIIDIKIKANEEFVENNEKTPKNREIIKKEKEPGVWVSKEVILRLITRLTRFSTIKRIPSAKSEKIYSILSDKAQIPIEPNQEFLNYMKHLKILKFFLKIFKLFRSNNNLIIHPYSNLKICWDILHFFTMVFVFFYLPLDLVFEIEISIPIRLTLSIFMFCDNLLGFSTAIFHHGKLITDRKKIAKAYLNFFICDIITQICLNSDLLLMHHDSEYPIKEKILRLAILFRFQRFKQIFLLLVDRFKIDMKFGQTLDFVSLIVISLCIIHWVACGWYLLGSTAGQTHNWLIQQDLIARPKIEQYIYSFYWCSVTMMTVGYGDILPQNKYETIFVTFVILIGCAFFAYYISTVGCLLQEINRNTMRFRNGLKVINNLMEKKNIKMELRIRIKEYLRFMWNEEKRQYDEEENRILGCLPDNLRQEFLLASYRDIFMENPVFFINFNKKALFATITGGFLKEERYSPGDIIFDEREYSSNPAIFFILSGGVDIYHEKSIRTTEVTKLNSLTKGQNFGEISFFSGRSRSASAKATDFTTILSLHRDDFLKVLEHFPEDREKFFMIQDQLKSDPKNQKLLRLSCYFCRNPLHLISQCPYFHFYPDRERVIKASDFSKPQKRMRFLRKSTKKSKFKVFPPRKNKEIELGTPNIPSSLISLTKERNSMVLEENSMKFNEKQDLKNNNNIFQLNLNCNNNNTNNNDFNEMVNFEEINNTENIENFEINNNISPIHKSTNKIEENTKNFTKNENQKNMDFSNFDDNESIDKFGFQKFPRKSKVEYEPFEIPKELKKYFPLFNISNFCQKYQKQVFLNKINRVKIETMRNISKYAINVEEMYAEISGEKRKNSSVLGLKKKKRSLFSKWSRKSHSLYNYTQIHTINKLKEKSRRPMFSIFRKKNATLKIKSPF